jgi:phage tail tape-measure protein
MLATFQVVKGNRTPSPRRVNRLTNEGTTMNRYLKAIVGAAIAGLTSVQASLEGGLTAGEYVTAAVALLVAFGAVWAVPNADS